jgi:nitroimidazol reductase NimA-like FMN-containing flavoprotein (pyridoxamine 5'-phosphate oxidase superfamily)
MPTAISHDRERDETDLRSLFDSQRLAVLATGGASFPYTSLVAFAVTPDLCHAVFATRTGTRKYALIESNPGVALLVDNRANRPEDFAAALAVTVLGNALVCAGAEAERYGAMLLGRHPELADFVRSPDCRIVAVEIARCLLVRRFEDVTEFLPNLPPEPPADRP